MLSPQDLPFFEDSTVKIEDYHLIFYDQYKKTHEVLKVKLNYPWLTLTNLLLSMPMISFVICLVFFDLIMPQTKCYEEELQITELICVLSASVIY